MTDMPQDDPIETHPARSRKGEMESFAEVLRWLGSSTVYVVVEYHHQRGYGVLYRPAHLLAVLGTGPDQSIGRQDLAHPAQLSWLRNRKGILGRISMGDQSYLVLSDEPSEAERAFCGKLFTRQELAELRIVAERAWEQYQTGAQ